MTKKDYEIIANAIKKVAGSGNADKDTLRMLISVLNTDLLYDNPRFRGRAFEIACGLTTSV